MAQNELRNQELNRHEEKVDRNIETASGCESG